MRYVFWIVIIIVLAWLIWPTKQESLAIPDDADKAEWEVLFKKYVLTPRPKAPDATPAQIQEGRIAKRVDLQNLLEYMQRMIRKVTNEIRRLRSLPPPADAERIAEIEEYKKMRSDIQKAIDYHRENFLKPLTSEIQKYKAEQRASQ